MIEESGSISLTNGFGSGRPKNIGILRIRILILIRNTAYDKISVLRIRIRNPGLGAF
jgi:hypothetical protein